MITRYLTCALFTLCTVAACSSDEDGGAGTGGTGAAGGQGGTGGTGGAGAAGGSGAGGSSGASTGGATSTGGSGTSTGGAPVLPGGDGGFGETEVIVDDPSCPDTSYNGMGLTLDLPGCCDASGVCGVSSATFATMVGIPVMCITPADAQARFGQSLPGDAGAETPCDYPADPGTPPEDAAAPMPDASGDASDNG